MWYKLCIFSFNPHNKLYTVLFLPYFINVGTEAQGASTVCQGS